MPTSFISERTAELILVPALLSALKPFYPKITPLYYWVSREGGIMSRKSFSDKQIKLLVLYARRPKIDYPGCPNIHIKINQILFERARIFQMNNIPVIAGFPLANKLDDIRPDVQCMWLKINPAGSEETFELLIEDAIGSAIHISQLSISDIVNLINNSSYFSWDKSIEKINEVRRSPTSDGRFNGYSLSGDLYKPIYLIIHEN